MSLTGSSNAFDNLGSNTARYCCDCTSPAAAAGPSPAAAAGPSPATVDAAAGPSPAAAAAPSPAANMSTTANMSPDVAVSVVLAIVMIVPVVFCCFYFLSCYQTEKKKKKTEETSNEAGKTITMDVELQSNPIKH